MKVRLGMHGTSVTETARMSKNFMDNTAESARASTKLLLSRELRVRRSKFGSAPGNLLPVVCCILTDTRA